MAFRAINRLSAAVVGEDLYAVRVTASPWGVKVRRAPVLRGFLRMSAEEVRRALADLGSAGSIVLTLPGGVCGVRPMQLGMRRWAGARPEVVRSIGKLFPLEPDEAVVGLIERTSQAPGAGASEGDAGERGYLVVASRREVQAWAEPLERALGTPVAVVLAPPMAMLGLGFQHEERVGIIEPSPSGGQEIHWLRYAEVQELGAPWSSEMDDSAEVGGATLRRLPSASDHDTGDATEQIDGFELAIGAALAPLVVGGRFAPLVGKAPGAPKRWAVPVGAGVAAAVLLWASGAIIQGRYERAIEHLSSEEASMASDLARVQGMRAELDAKNALIEQGVGKTIASWTSVMPDLTAAHAVVPATGFIYEVGVDGTRVFLRGEAPRASDVLRAMESSPAFESPKQQSPVSPVGERSAEAFDLVATRRSAATSAASGASPEKTSGQGGTTK